jgi:Dyggve-Melchior-Clausen syndrome protein
VYALLHRQEVFAPFRSQHRFADLMENIFLVLDHFNAKVSRFNPQPSGLSSFRICPLQHMTTLLLLARKLACIVEIARMDVLNYILCGSYTRHNVAGGGGAG